MSLIDFLLNPAWKRRFEVLGMVVGGIGVIVGLYYLWVFGWGLWLSYQ